METTDKLRQILHQHNLKSTKVRKVVLDLLLDSNVAMSHNHISDVLKTQNQEIDKVTLYRTLNTFVEKGLAHKVATEDRNWLYAIYDDDAEHANHEHEHAHFICLNCDKIYCFPVDENTLYMHNKELQGFEVQQTEIRLHGRCPVCK